MWATFCKPCIAEIPGFIEVVDKFGERVELMLVSVDMKGHYPKKILDFARAHKFNTPMAWLNETNADYFCPMLDKNWSGSIPATLIVNTSTGYRKFFEEEMSSDALEKEIESVLNSR
jgi:thiol-disulfide isomerase/thioredoxin